MWAEPRECLSINFGDSGGCCGDLRILQSPETGLVGQRPHW